MPKKTLQQLEILGSQVEVMVVEEYRNSYRASVGKQKLIFRVPRGLGQEQLAQAWRWFIEWAERLYHEQPAVFKPLVLSQYSSADILQVGKKRYTVNISLEERLTSSGRLLPGNEIQLRIGSGLGEIERHKATKTLLSRIVAQDFLPEITLKVGEINAQFIRKPVRQVRLSYQHSKWGSCSSHGNINLSTRLLFAPDEVIDYVILHELAHLVEMNHSPRFWEIVRKAMPEFRERERWLREHGPGCDF
jgi:predicted metal-dependent hydrolase